jgi:hypothetical protein
MMQISASIATVKAALEVGYVLFWLCALTALANLQSNMDRVLNRFCA